MIGRRNFLLVILSYYLISFKYYYIPQFSIVKILIPENANQMPNVGHGRQNLGRLLRRKAHSSEHQIFEERLKIYD